MKRIRRLCGQCIGADRIPVVVPVDCEEQEHNIELESLDVTSLPPSENYPHENSCCTVIGVSEELMPPDLLVAVVDAVHVQYADGTNFNTLTDAGSPSTFTGPVSCKQERKFSNQSTIFYPPLLNSNEAVVQEIGHSHGNLTNSVETNDCVQHVSTCSDAIHSLQRQTGDTPVFSLHEVYL